MTGVPAGLSPPVQLTAPAKLTLSLAVTGVRPDGYHLLESEMVTLDLADTLFIEGRAAEEPGNLAISADPSRPTTRWEPDAIPLGTDNLVARALVAVGRSAEVHIVKLIPPGAGLGGGSTDAAAVLRWAGCTDLTVAASLGADVPFCLTGGRAVVRGIGESVTPLPYEDRRFTLLLLPFGVGTAAVYQAWDRLAGLSDRMAGAGSGNDLEAAAMLVEPRLGAWRDRFEGLTGRRPRLAGSGSSWFVEGSPGEIGVRDGQSVQVGDETGLLMAVRTTPPLA
ncbi:MAG: 4-(cytidine 5'-diphospho)-2-C-methyl-D-erythritol kinase [Acidimicrobiales bacterium]|jgi:4-diphosphocytidyl-2-C-methyl-D-erythritol kinase